MIHKNCLHFSYDLDSFFFIAGEDIVDLSLTPITLEQIGKRTVVNLFGNEVNKIYFSEKCLRKWFLNV